jgi:hypothetical protein
MLQVLSETRGLFPNLSDVVERFPIWSPAHYFATRFPKRRTKIPFIERSEPIIDVPYLI